MLSFFLYSGYNVSVCVTCWYTYQRFESTICREKFQYLYTISRSLLLFLPSRLTLCVKKGGLLWRYNAIPAAMVSNVMCWKWDFGSVAEPACHVRPKRLLRFRALSHKRTLINPNVSVWSMHSSSDAIMGRSISGQKVKLYKLPAVFLSGKQF